MYSSTVWDRRPKPQLPSLDMGQRLQIGLELYARSKGWTHMDNAARAIYRAAFRLRDLHPDFTVSQLQLLALVALEPGCTQARVYERLAQSDSSISRNIALLSEIGNRYRGGLSLISVKVNQQDRRERLLFLTEKGKRLFRDIEGDFLYGNN